MLRTRLGRAGALVAAGALLLVACGGAEEVADDVAAEPTRLAAATTPDRATEDAASDSRTAVAASGDGAQVLTAAIAAAEQLPTARTRVVATTATPDGEVRVTAEGVQSGVDAELRIVFAGAGLDGPDGEQVEVDVVLLDRVVYQRFPLLTAQLGTDAEWIAVDVEVLGPEFADVLDAIESADPAGAMSVFEDAADVRVVGEEQVNGVATTHLVVAISLRDALAANGLDESVLDGRSVDLDEVVEYDLWVDDRSRMRRIAVDLEVDGMTTSSVVDVLEYDVPARIEAPPPEDTVGFGELMGAVIGGGATG